MLVLVGCIGNGINSLDHSVSNEEFHVAMEAKIHLRFNHVGYSPIRTKKIIVMSDIDQSKGRWRLFDKNGNVALTGFLGSSLFGKTSHTPKNFNYIINLTPVQKVGSYSLKVADAEPVTIQVKQNLYDFMIADILRHLRVARSGSAGALLHPESHRGDKNSKIYRSIGDLDKGEWEVDPSKKIVDMLGGWYDAGDYIKFTLTIAYTAYYLLRAYETYPDIFKKENSLTSLVDVLDEAKHGLDYLLKTLPDNNEFIIQVSTGADHKEKFRMPEHDKRDGRREALSAISPAYMGLTSAALALGANIFHDLGEIEQANQYRLKALSIYQRARQADALRAPVFERDEINDFYKDEKSEDNMGLAAIELYRLTGKSHFLSDAKSYSDLAGNGGWAAWCCVTSSLNFRLAHLDSKATEIFLAELTGFESYDQDNGNIWGLPMRQYWGPLQGAFIAAAYSGLAFMAEQRSDASLMWNNIDYFLGRNNWGIAFIASPEVPNSVRNVYSQIYQLTNEFPLGAVAEGPGDRATYEKLKNDFKAHPSDDLFEEFNTEQEVFFDNSSNYQAMESVITLQASAIYMLSVAAQVDSILSK